jgi:Flp pilus assembly pilin Flp
MRTFFRPLVAYLCAKGRSSKGGQTLVEYSLIIGMMGVLAVGVYGLLDAKITMIFSVIIQTLDTDQSATP